MRLWKTAGVGVMIEPFWWSLNYQISKDWKVWLLDIGPIKFTVMLP